MKKRLLPLFMALGLLTAALFPAQAFAWGGSTIYDCNLTITNPHDVVTFSADFRSFRDATATYAFRGYTFDIDCE